MTEKTRLEELWDEHGWRCVPHGERDCDVCGIDECEACPKWEKIAAILCLERGNALRDRDEARANALKVGENWWQACERARIYRGAAIHVFKEWCEDDQQACRNDLLQRYPWLTDEAEL